MKVIRDLMSAWGKVMSWFGVQDFVLLWARVSAARIFYESGRTKAQSVWGEGYLTINDFQETLFAEEYGITFIEPTMLAQAALYAETLFPLMLLFGVGARLSSAFLIGMTIFIQVFVYPSHFMEHVTWAVMLLAVLILGPGKLSLDHYLHAALKSEKNKM